MICNLNNQFVLFYPAKGPGLKILRKNRDVDRKKLGSFKVSPI